MSPRSDYAFWKKKLAIQAKLCFPEHGTLVVVDLVGPPGLEPGTKGFA